MMGDAPLLEVAVLLHPTTGLYAFPQGPCRVQAILSPLVDLEFGAAGIALKEEVSSYSGILSINDCYIHAFVYDTSCRPPSKQGWLRKWNGCCAGTMVTQYDCAIQCRKDRS